MNKAPGQAIAAQKYAGYKMKYCIKVDSLFVNPSEALHYIIWMNEIDQSHVKKWILLPTIYLITRFLPFHFNIVLICSALTPSICLTNYFCQALNRFVNKIWHIPLIVIVIGWDCDVVHSMHTYNALDFYPAMPLIE